MSDNDVDLQAIENSIDSMHSTLSKILEVLEEIRNKLLDRATNDGSQVY